MSAEMLGQAAGAIRFDASDPDGPWSQLPDSLAPAVAAWLVDVAELFDDATDRIISEQAMWDRALAVARAYLEESDS